MLTLLSTPGPACVTRLAAQSPWTPPGWLGGGATTGRVLSGPRHFFFVVLVTRVVGVTRVRLPARSHFLLGHLVVVAPSPGLRLVLLRSPKEGGSSLTLTSIPGQLPLRDTVPSRVPAVHSLPSTGSQIARAAALSVHLSSLCPLSANLRGTGVPVGWKGPALGQNREYLLSPRGGGRG